MREIKFRAFDKKINQWIVEGFHIFGEVTLFNMIGIHCFETKGEGDSLDRYGDIEVSEFTGLKDKNGKEIYEGDIVTVSYGKGKVIFNAACFMIEWIDDPEANMELLSMEKYKTGHVREDLEVIGNIYEHPLLAVT
jgi:uncharacterized phage protein (TIGR01671 family)